MEVDGENDEDEEEKEEHLPGDELGAEEDAGKRQKPSSFPTLSSFISLSSSSTLVEQASE